MTDQTVVDVQDLATVLDPFVTGLAHSSRSPVLRNPADAGIAYQDISYPSSDGTPLEAWFIPCEGSTKLIVSLHAFGMNRYGFPAHIEPWKSAFGPGNDTEVDFIQDYKILHDAGYNVLTFDFRNHGLTSAANGNLASNNRFEARDVIGTLNYIRMRPDLAGMTLGILARCMGANATFRAIDEDPHAFRDVKCLVAPLLLSPLAFLETVLDASGLGEHADEVDRRFHLITGERLVGGTVSRWAPSVTMPTLTYGVHGDTITRPADLEDAYAALGATEKDMFWIEDTPRRWDGYKWFQRHPERVLEWFDTFMK
ncbi:MULTISPECIES: alpha/beta hydrolase family protein [unclassified Modestobacter]|uniref:alpha/beta hydrolase family protein n=1 Tax=unclassified Modestobacter TaxID=2643866 RepID=UPI0022AA2B5F|nr:MULTISPECIES: alpha/beta hydrolase [unclassified Modestobacter]MCZ2811946.1 alpha/beta hydrolase [Modestobacter sp. VKM Ac-2979]MCZ2843669.1 alpha/beta hydrolase [Modestobacter sp. VKM Ac-2980]MCZ2850830.1 alpha/beta hydrolase [Modestobacter sp. VKM Ac-2978]